MSSYPNSNSKKPAASSREAEVLERQRQMANRISVRKAITTSSKPPPPPMPPWLVRPLLSCHRRTARYPSELAVLDTTTISDTQICISSHRHESIHFLKDMHETEHLGGRSGMPDATTGSGSAWRPDWQRTRRLSQDQRRVQGGVLTAGSRA